MVEGIYTFAKRNTARSPNIPHAHVIMPDSTEFFPAVTHIKAPAANAAEEMASSALLIVTRERLEMKVNPHLSHLAANR